MSNATERKANLTSETSVYVHCPHCGAKDNLVSHLFNDPIESSFGPWYCDSCGGSYKGRVIEENWVVLTPLEESRIPQYVLLEIPPREESIFFITTGMAFRKLGNDIDDEKRKNEYFYNEHTCPTNWLKDVQMIAYDGNLDPHGIARYVRHVDKPSLDHELDDDYEFVENNFPEIEKGREL